MAMEIVKLDSQTLPSIADAIRTKTGSTDLLLPSQMAGEIAAIPTGGGLPTKGLVFGDYDADGYPTSARIIGPWDRIPHSYAYSLFGTGNFSKNITSIAVPEGVAAIGNSAFRLCGSLQSVTFAEGLIDIDNFAFWGCTKPTALILPESLRRIGLNAFYGCTALREVRFLGTPTESIAADAFRSDTNLTDIYVPWSEGAVANAPWGATNATIHYDTAGGTGA